MNSRRKGICGELEAARLWRRWFPDCRRSFGQARDGYEQPDLIGGVERDFYIEVKRYKTLRGARLGKATNKATRDWIRWQADNDPGDKTNLVVMYREDGRDWMVVTQPEAIYDVVFRDGQRLRAEDTTMVALPVLITLPWSDFAAALDEIYPVKTNPNDKENA